MNGDLSEYLKRRHVLVKEEVYSSMVGKYGEAELEAALMVIANSIRPNNIRKISLTDPVDSNETPVQPVHITPKMIDNYFSR
jgi:hypothetical protein